MGGRKRRTPSPHELMLTLVGGKIVYSRGLEKWRIRPGVRARPLKAAPGCLISSEFHVCLKPGLRFVFALPGAERLPVTCPAGAFQVLGIAPETNGRGSGCIRLVWLHGLSNG